MDSFSVASLSSLCSAISHSAIACAAELADLLGNIPPSQHAEQLASLSEALQEFSVSVNQFEASIGGASTISPQMQEKMGHALGTCQAKLGPLGKQVMRLQPDTVPSLNGMFVTVNGDLLVAYTQLLGFFQEVLAMTQKEDQDATLDGPEGRRITETADDAARMLSKAGEIIVNAEDAAPVKDERNIEQPPPYSYEASSSAPGSSSAGPSSAPGSSAQDNNWGFSLKQTFKALTSGLRAKPDPLVTALCEASRRGDVGQIAAFLRQGANIDGKNENSETPLHCAILANQTDSARLLLASGADEKQWSKMPPMFLAASVGNLEVAAMIHERGGVGANVKKESMSGQPYFVDVVSSGNLDGVRFLLERRANAKAESVSGRPVVVQAAKKGSVDMVKLLLDFGAKVNSDDITGSSMMAIALDKSNLELMDLLISRGAKLGSRTGSGERILAAAISKKNMLFVKRLLEAGADAGIEDIYGQKIIVNVVKDTKISNEDKVWMVQMLLKNGAKATSRDIFWPNLHVLPTAIDKGADGRVISMLIQHGAEANKTLHSGETLLTHAINNGRTDQVEALLDNQADPSLANKMNKTPLMLALVKQDLELVRLLARHGADVDAPRQSAREFALTLGRADILEVLGAAQGGGSVSGTTGGDGPPGYEAAVTGKN